jgi:putative hydrolase of the HAD superfamily
MSFAQLNMPNLRAVLFDLDDTLTDRARSIERLAPLFTDHFSGQLEDVQSDQIIRCIKTADGGGYASREALCAHLQSSLPWRKPPGAEELVAFWRTTFPRCNVERAGVTPLLQALYRRGLKLGVISNGAMTQYVKLDVMGVRPFLSVTLISDEVGIKKPDPRIFQMALDRLGMAASEMIFVGDNLQLDVAGARGVGIRAIWLNYENRPVPAGVEFVIAFEQLLPLCEL